MEHILKDEGDEGFTSMMPSHSFPWFFTFSHAHSPLQMEDVRMMIYSSGGVRWVGFLLASGMEKVLVAGIPLLTYVVKLEGGV